MRGEPAVGTADKQRATLTKIADVAAQRPWLDALLLVGSLADDAADALSDIDLLAVVREGQFQHAWADRRYLHAREAVCAWDQRPNEQAEVAAHKWLTPDLVLVEVLIATPSSGVRLADPWAVVAGDREAPGRLTQRSPIQRTEMGAVEVHPVEAAYDEFKSRIRRACSSPDRAV